MWDAIQFCRIVDNLFFWAQHCLKPMVTQYLSQWRQRYCPDVPRIHSLLEKDTKTSEMVHQIQDHLSFLGLSPNEDLPALVRQAVVFQGVLKSSNNELKADLTAKEESKLPTGISLPSRPRENSLAVPLSSLTEPQQGIHPKVGLKGKENLPNTDLSAGEIEEGTVETFYTNDNLTLPLKPHPKHQTPVHSLKDKGKEPAGETSIVPEDKNGEHSVIFLLSCNHQLLILFLAILTNVLTNKPTSSNSKMFLFPAGRWEETFFEPGQMKNSSAEASLFRPLSRPQFRLIRMNLARDQPIVEPLPTPTYTGFKAKIPWRGKNIIVRLPPAPPAMPASVSVQGNSDSTKI